jgi:hypothetical protein
MEHQGGDSAFFDNNITAVAPPAPLPDTNKSSAILSNEVQAGIIPAKSGLNKHQQNENYSKSGINEGDSGTVVIVIGILSAALLLILVVVLILYRNIISKTGDTMNFDNPVYRKTTTEDPHICIEKTQGFHKSYPATITEEAQEPLTGNLGVNEYV